MSQQSAGVRSRRRILLRRVLLLFGSTLLSWTLLVQALRAYVVWVGADVGNGYLCEPRSSMWQKDTLIGYVNRPNLRLEAFGNVVGHTNEAGFRAFEDLAEEKPEGTFRLCGIGDSVMWGTRVILEDSFLGKLAALLESVHPEVELINAVVVGYSTYQERLMFEHRIVPFHPDLVLVN